MKLYVIIRGGGGSIIIIVFVWLVLFLLLLDVNHNLLDGPETNAIQTGKFLPDVKGQYLLPSSSSSSSMVFLIWSISSSVICFGRPEPGFHEVGSATEVLPVDDSADRWSSLSNMDFKMSVYELISDLE